VKSSVEQGSAALGAWLDARRQWADACLERHLSLPQSAPDASGPARVQTAMRYALFGGGKRLRPALVHLVATELGAREQDCELPAAAIECIHTYSLVHDDLPCMDDDDLRRGRPTCHVQFGEALALLCGDALQAAAFELLARGPDGRARAWTGVLAEAAGALGMVGGQAADLELGKASAPDLDHVRAMHAQKTGALMRAAAELGAVAADADAARRARARAFGASLGAVFQATDDLLDVTGAEAELGKTPGKDARHGRSTLVSALGLDGARREAERLAAECRERARELGLAEGGVACRLPGWLLLRRN